MGQPQPSYNKRYNGWANYNTWTVNLWLSNVEAENRYWVEQARVVTMFHGGDRPKAVAALAVKMQKDITDKAPALGGMYDALLRSALAEVDWYEIAEAFIEPF
jgi:hypothetical protein